MLYHPVLVTFVVLIGYAILVAKGNMLQKKTVIKEALKKQRKRRSSFDTSKGDKGDTGRQGVSGSACLEIWISYYQHYVKCLSLGPPRCSPEERDEYVVLLPNKGLCVITTRIPVADIADHERTSAARRDLEQLSNDAGASFSGRWGSTGMKLHCEERATSSAAIVLVLPCWAAI